MARLHHKSYSSNSKQIKREKDIRKNLLENGHFADLIKEQMKNKIKIIAKRQRQKQRRQQPQTRPIIDEVIRQQQNEQKQQDDLKQQQIPDDMQMKDQNQHYIQILMTKDYWNLPHNQQHIKN